MSNIIYFDDTVTYLECSACDLEIAKKWDEDARLDGTICVILRKGYKWSSVEWHIKGLSRDRRENILSRDGEVLGYLQEIFRSYRMDSYSMARIEITGWMDKLHIIDARRAAVCVTELLEAYAYGSGLKYALWL